MPPIPRNSDVADALDELADVSEVLGEQGFRVIAYRRAATRVRETAASIAELALAGRAKELPGIGGTIEAKIVELTETGHMAALEKRRAEVPGEVTQFLRIPGLGPKTAARIWRELDVTTLDELREAAEQQRVRTLQGLGAKSEEKILAALDKGFGAEPERRGLLGIGLPVVREVVEALREHPASVEVSGAGSVRRGRETFRDLDVIATAADPAALIGHFVTLPWVLEIAARGDTKATVVTKQGLRLDLRVVPPEDYGSLLQHFTGSKDHNVALREEAQRRGLSISEYGVTVVESGEVHRFRSEAELYRFLGYGWIPPELRENGGRAGRRQGRRASGARRGLGPQGRAALPFDLVVGRPLVDRGDGPHRKGRRLPLPRADRPLALPPRRADGGAMAGDRRGQRAREAVPRAQGRRGEHPLRRNDRRLRRRCSQSWTGWSRRSTRRSTGTRPSGSSRRSTTRTSTASATSPAGSSTAVRAPMSTSSGSWRGRSRPGTALEINSQPDRLDMRDVHARLAGEAGVLVPITTDAHSAAALGYRELGVAQARRAWLTKEQVLNTRSWREVAARRPGR